MRRLLLASLIATSSVLLMAACRMDDAPPSGTSAGPTPVAVNSAVPVPHTSVAPIPATSTASMPTTYEGDVQVALTTVAQYWSGQFAQHGLAFTPVRRITPYHGSNGPSCNGVRLSANNAAYCPDGDYIGYDTDFFRTQWTSIGHAFVYFALGHEYGHAIQARLQLSAPVQIKAELQADCFSGAYLRGAIDAGQLAVRRGDLDQMMNSLNAVGDPPGTPWLNSQAHGSATNRKIAFFDGYALKTHGCTTKL